jgi:hypothetical protein
MEMSSSTSRYLGPLVLVAALSAAHVPAAYSQGMTERVYTKEEVFAGLIFGAGPAAELFPEIWGLPAKALEDAAEFLQQTDLIDAQGAATLTRLSNVPPGTQPQPARAAMYRIAVSTYRQIEQADPAFVQGFWNEVRSGDPRRVHVALVQVSRRINQVLLGVADTLDPASRNGTVTWIDTNAFVNKNYAINTNVAINVDTFINITRYITHLFLTEENQLRSEVVANLAAQTLGAVSIAGIAQ